MKKKDIYRVGVGILSSAITIPGWWKTRTYEDMRADWSHGVLATSVKEDREAGEDIPADVLANFPEL